MRILVINGPNLNMTGIRQPEIYGTTNFDTFLAGLRDAYPEHELIYFQSNSEGALIDFIQKEMENCHGIIINPGAYAHSSIAIADALKTYERAVIEVHLSNVLAREPYRAHSYTAFAAIGTISGFGLDVYEMALTYLLTHFNKD